MEFTLQQQFKSGVKMKKYNLFLIPFLFALNACVGVQLTEDRTPMTKTIERSLYQYDILIPYITYSSTPVDLTERCRQQPWKSVYVTGNVFSTLGLSLSATFVRPYKVELNCLAPADTTTAPVAATVL